MLTELLTILRFIIDAFLHIWPYLVITIPLAVTVNMTGASKYIGRAFETRPIVAIFLATIVGAFSPFCSCGVIPVVAALLIGGVPLAPVMAFWIASPSMDPEIFFLSVATIGWELAAWRLAVTLVLSLSAGFITYFTMQQGWLGREILRRQQPVTVQSSWTILKKSWQRLKHGLRPAPMLQIVAETPIATMQTTSCASTNTTESAPPHTEQNIALTTTSFDSNYGDSYPIPEPEAKTSCSIKPVSFRRRLIGETWAATTMVARFMALAFFLEALIQLYIPSEWIVGILGGQNPWAILLAAGLGIPAYTSNLAALPMVSGLLTQGMLPAAGLAFLIAGPTTTLPAMAAVWGLVSRRVFGLYISFSLLGAIAAGYLYQVMKTL